MPIYEYRCQQCGQQFEAIQKFSDEPLQTHQGCGGAVERLISAPGFQFKGSGWYVTDYSKSGGGTNGKANDGKSTESKSSDPSSSAPAAASGSGDKS